MIRKKNDKKKKRNIFLSKYKKLQKYVQKLFKNIEVFFINKKYFTFELLMLAVYQWMPVTNIFN